MKTKRLPLMLGLLLIPSLLTTGLLTLPPASSVHAQSPTGDSDASVLPVEGDMHEFMEYVFQPPYKRLKAAMAVAEKDNAVWKTIKSDSLILAEGGNLLLARGPEADEADWNEHSVMVRSFGGQLYRAAKKKDEAESQKVYRLMLDNCNVCHQQFADGEHQLAP
jgi:hypothetical protein